MQNNNTLIEFMAKEEPFAMCIVEGAGYGTVYKISWSVKQPDHFVLHHPESGDLCAVVHKRDPYYMFYNVEKLNKPHSKKIIQVTRKDGVSKCFDSYSAALTSGAVESNLHISFGISAQIAMEGILDEMENDGFQNCSWYRSLKNLSEHVALEEPDFDLAEFSREMGGASVKYYMTMYHNPSKETYRHLLMEAAQLFGWTVTGKEVCSDC